MHLSIKVLLLAIKSLVYGFFDECKRRTNVKVWKTFTNFFNCLPIAALISGIDFFFTTR